MPIHQRALKEQTLIQYKNHSYEFLLLSWLLMGGWEASKPSVDLGLKTDVQVSDGRTLYRIQVKSLDSIDDNIIVENMWGDVDIDYIVYFSKNADWGYITPAFKEKRKQLKSSNHIRFHQHPKCFLNVLAQT
ncbi:MAG: hypothetical protein LKF82_12330 [Acinetobacter populi]|jgi:hypothetical protein|uniref:hypothetical protein n=1 Tax=Acinetobacter populi TaxID=1582270 RepID=UPI002352B741|nr:hypothetical protein [Acinetobacter populi]MCH4248593.1 hypothetical protein [Acinetobacter populi]